MQQTENQNIDLLISWGLSLVGRAPALHAGGQEFDSPSLHQISRQEKQRFSLKFKQEATLRAGFDRTKLELSAKHPDKCLDPRD